MNSDYLKDIIKLFTYYRELGFDALEQVSERDLFFRKEPQSNSLAILVKHLSGNMLSRWTDFLTSDGEKQWRNREGEFEQDMTRRKEVMKLWDQGWNCLLDALNSLEPEDISKTILIRNTKHTVSEAINRQLAHYAYHVGQIVFLAKEIKKEDWRSLSIPKGGSAAFNKTRFDSESKRSHFTDDLK